MKKPVLYLLPMPISGENVKNTIHPHVVELWHEISIYFVEGVKAVRRTMKKMDKEIDVDSMTFSMINEHHSADLDLFDRCVMEGQDMALMSEAGSPAVADPGHRLVCYAHDRGVRVVPIAGPNSMILALMSSGFDGNKFSFHGYLNRDRKERVRDLRRLEQKVKHESDTVIFMDAPYRNEAVLQDIIQNIDPSLGLCIATEITSPMERINTKSIADWGKNLPKLHKKNVVFVMGSFD